MNKLPKCKNCKERFYPLNNNTLQKFCLKDECIKAHVEFSKKEKEKEWKKRKPRIKEELKTVQTLMKEAQKEFNSFIRKRDKGLPCISCGKKWSKDFQACHYFSSGHHKNVTFDEFNVHGGCVECNLHKAGNITGYTIGIEQRIGEEEYILLRERAYETRKFTREELINIKNKYKNLF